MAKLLFFGAPSLAGLVRAEVIDALRAVASGVQYADGVTIQSRGDAKASLSLIRSGAVRIGNPGSDGSIVTTAIFGPGHCFGEMTLFGDLPRTHDAVAIGATVIDHIASAAYERVRADYPELDQAMLTMLSRRLHAMLEFADDLRRLPLLTQAAKLLLSMLSAGEHRVDMTQDVLATILGVTRVSIAAALKQLEQHGLIERGYGGVIVPDRLVLSRWVADRTTLSRF